MSAAFEEAWIFLKAAFQPVEGYRIGEGANQIVYGQGGNPDVAKVGSASTVDDLYFNELLKPIAPTIFPGQRLVAQQVPFPSEAQSRFVGRSPILSQQIRGVPFPDTKNYAQNMADSRANMVQAYDHPKYGPLLEALGLADLKRPNFMKVPGYDKPLIHDPMFYGPENPTNRSTPEYMAARLARETPRRLGIDYSIPDELKESLARRVDELPFDDYIEPIHQSEVPLSLAEQRDLDDELMRRALYVDSILGKVGVLR